MSQEEIRERTIPHNFFATLGRFSGAGVDAIPQALFKSRSDCRIVLRRFHRSPCLLWWAIEQFDDAAPSSTSSFEYSILGAVGFDRATPRPAGPYYITQLDTNLNVEWQFQNTTIDANHPNGYEWCVNAPAIDSNGVVYANSEDGNVYAIAQGNSGVSTTPKQKMFLKLALGAAYTPLSVGSDGKLYMQNDGHLLVVGN